MKLRVDEKAVQRELAPLLEDEGFRRGLEVLASDPFFVAFFLMSVSEGEGLGEAGVAAIGQEELASRIRDLKRIEREERAHKERTLDAARDLFPEHFAGDRYRYEAALFGRPYYVAVLRANRERLERARRYSRLNLYLTTTFAYEVMVVLLYRAVADAVGASSLPESVRVRVARVLESILAEEETHLGVIEEHNALLETPRSVLSAEATSMLESLETLRAEDYTWPAERAVREILGSMARYAEPEQYRAEIEASATF